MKILLLTEFFPHLRNPSFAGGVEARSYFLAKNLVKRHKIIVIARRQNKIPDKEKVKSLLVIRCGLKTSSSEATFLSFFSRFTFFLQSIFIGLRQDFDIIEGSNFVTFIPTFIIAQIKKKPSVIWYPDVLIGEWTKYFGIILGLIGEFTERVSLKLPFKKIIALSNQTQKKLINQKINFKKIIVIYGGYDPKEFRGKPPKKFPLFTICTISRLVPYKKIDVLIKAFKLVKEKISDANLIIIGQGQQEKKLRRIVQSEKISDSVGFFKGDNRKKTLSILKKSHLFCLPSVIEGFGFVTIEAMAAGLPVILTDISINREITQQGKGVLFFKPNNEKDLSQKILTILQNKQLATKLRKEQIKFKSLYTWYRMTAETEKIYLSLLKQ